MKKRLTIRLTAGEKKLLLSEAKRLGSTPSEILLACFHWTSRESFADENASTIYPHEKTHNQTPMPDPTRDREPATRGRNAMPPL